MLVLVICTIAMIESESGIQTKPELSVRCFGELSRELIEGSGYKIEIPQDLEARPVVIYFDKERPGLQRLRGMLSVLSLELETREEEKTLVVKKGDLFSGRTRQARIRDTITDLQEFVQPFLKLDAKETYKHSLELRKQARTLERGSAERRNLERQALILRDASYTRGQILVNSLVEANASNVAQLLLSPCTERNRLLLSPASQRLVGQYLAGNGAERTDVTSQADYRAEEWEFMLALDADRREAIRKHAAKSPIPVVSHTTLGRDEIVLSFNLVTADSHGLQDTLTLPMLLPDVVPPKQGTGWVGYDHEFVPLSTFGTGVFTVNSIGGLAPQLQVDYAGWLSMQTLPGLFGECTIKALTSTNPMLRVRVVDGWLQVVDYSDPIPDPFGDWPPFLRIRALLSKKGLAASELKREIEKLTDAQLDGIELIGVALSTLPQTDKQWATSLRLLRAALRQHDDADFATLDGFKTKVRDMKPEAKADARAFGKGHFVWMNFIQLFHPDNSGVSDNSEVSVSFSQGNGRRELQVVWSLPKEVVDSTQSATVTFKFSLN